MRMRRAYDEGPTLSARVTAPRRTSLAPIEACSRTGRWCMSRQLRYRITAFVLGGLIFGAPLLTNGSASAEQLSPSNEGGRQVTFSGGGVLVLSCHSTPDIESMVVPADSTVRVVNQTGYSAQLRLGGDAKGSVPDESATEVVFRRGTTSVLLKPNCPLGDDATPVLVTATPSAPDPMPDQMPAPAGG